MLGLPLLRFKIVPCSVSMTASMDICLRCSEILGSTNTSFVRHCPGRKSLGKRKKRKITIQKGLAMEQTSSRCATLAGFLYLGGQFNSAILPCITQPISFPLFIPNIMHTNSFTWHSVCRRCRISQYETSLATTGDNTLSCSRCLCIKVSCVSFTPPRMMSRRPSVRQRI